jgi:GntR family transcriptional regulator, phosphonate transport system regulatory protein
MYMPMSLERRKGEALWSQIAGALARDIEEGALKLGERLPTEAQLAERYDVNRHTIRRALEELGDARIIRTEHGRGSFVAEEVMDYRIGKRPRFSEWVRGANRTPMGEILRLEEVMLSELPEAETAGAALQLAPDAMVILLERVGSADDRPLSLSRHIFSSAAYPGLLVALRENASITAALAAVGVADFTRLWTRVCARTPDVREARLLRMARTDALLACEALNATEGGALVEFGASCYPAPRVQLVFES